MFLTEAHEDASLAAEGDPLSSGGGGGGGGALDMGVEGDGGARRVDIPFKTIRYLVGECNYGGRVTDPRDQRCLMQTLDNFMNPVLLEMENYAFSESGTYLCPDTSEYVKWVFTVF